MLFNSALYLLFLPLVVLTYWLIDKHWPRWCTLFLLLASYVFYMVWNPIYILLILALTAINFFFGHVIEAQRKQKKFYFIAGIVSNLGCLAYFKYAYMAIDGINLLGHFFPNNQDKLVSYPVHHIILPLGISFFVFEFIHYLTDVYKGSPAVKKPLEFALFPSFFPTQIAGPIKRFQDFLPQLFQKHKPDLAEVDAAIELIAFGLAKKVLIADNLAIVVDKCMPHPEHLSSLDAWMLLWAFLFQVYFDFSGYTDIARGSAALLGFKVPINFDLPLMSASITEYWRRWHISLSLWLRDYLFFPLGGSRGTFLRTSFNSLATMTLAGLWHGAGIGYIAFGFIHGLYLCLHKAWRILVEKNAFLKQITETKVFTVLSILLTFNAIAFSLVTFRLQNLSVAQLYYQKLFAIFTPAPAGQEHFQMTIPNIEGAANFATFPLLLLVLVLAQFLCKLMAHKEPLAFMRETFKPLKPLRPVYLAALALALLLFSPDGTPSFVYFQF
jgi:D-alanyl-lipoteichoic acid acyltransferase DltB (MBOAT superfamily)